MNNTLKERVFIVARKTQEFALYATVFFIPISIALVELFVSVALVAFIVKKIITPDFTFIKTRIHFFVLLFYIFCGFSLLNSGHHIHTSIHALFLKWGQYILIFLMVQDALISDKHLRIAVKILLFGGCLVAIDGIFQYFCGWEFLRERKIMLMGDSIKAITGPFPHYNGFAAYLICPICLNA